jgi:hypothetical protein
LKTHKDFEEKRLLALDRERSRLWKLHRTTIQLPQPIQRGWIRGYFLTDEARQRMDAPVLERILGFINAFVPHWRRSFTPTKRNRRRQVRELDQALRTLSRWQLFQRSFPEGWRAYFVEESILLGRRWEVVYHFRWPHLFELKVAPRMIERVQVCDPVVASRLAEVERQFEDPRNRGRLEKLRGSSWSSFDERRHILQHLAVKRIRAAMAGDVEAEMKACRFLRGFISVSFSPV